MAPVLCRPPGDMAPGLEWVFPLCWHPLMQTQDPPGPHPHIPSSQPPCYPGFPLAGSREEGTA